MKRLPIVLSVAALVIAVMGVTPLGEAAKNALPFAKNADRVDKIHASTTPKAGQLYPLGKNTKFPAKVLSVTRGPKGDSGEMGQIGASGPQGPAGPQGLPGIQTIREVTNWTMVGPLERRFVKVTCPAGMRPIGGSGATDEYFIGDGVTNTYDGWTAGAYNSDPVNSKYLAVAAYCSPNVVWIPAPAP